MSAEQAIEIAKSIYAIRVRTPNTNQTITKVLYLTEKQQELAKLFNFRLDSQVSQCRTQEDRIVNHFEIWMDLWRSSIIETTDTRHLSDDSLNAHIISPLGRTSISPLEGRPYCS